MREHLSAILRSTVIALADAALGALLIALMLALYDIERSVSLAVGLFAALYAVQAIANECMAARSAPMLLFLFVNAALLIPGANIAVAHTVFTPSSAGFPVLLRIILLLSGVHSAFCMRRLPGSNLFVRYGDALIAGLAVYLASSFGLGRAYNPVVLLFALCALLLCMVIASALRSGGESDSVIRGAGAGGYLVLFALLLLCLLLTGGALSLGSGHVDSVVALLALLWQGICRAGNLLMNTFARFVLLFAGSGRNVRSDASEPISADYADMELPAAAEMPEWLPALLLIALGAAVLAGVIGILLSLRGKKFTRAARAKRKRRVVRRSHLLPALLAALRRVYDRICFEVLCVAQRRTPQGLFVLAQRTGKRRHLPRRASESAGAYLRRYHAALSAQGEASPLAPLADALDLALYGGQSIRFDPAQYRLYADAIRRLPVQERHASPAQES